MTLLIILAAAPAISILAMMTIDFVGNHWPGSDW